MELKMVESSMIHAVGYDPETRTLEVIFNSGGIYLYEDVPPEVYEGLMKAESKGATCMPTSLTCTLTTGFPGEARRVFQEPPAVETASTATKPTYVG